MNKVCYITGGSGFVGRSIINYMEDEYKFITLGRTKVDGCENNYWDLKEKINCVNCENADYFIHSASIVGSNNNYSITDYIDINVKSTIETLEFCIKNNIKNYIYISTGGVYGYSNELLGENSICSPKDIYSISKKFSEKICDLYSERLNISILRLFFPYGKGQRDRLIPNLINNIKYEKEIILYKNGFPKINPIHIYDAIYIIKEIMISKSSGIYNICGDEIITIKELCDKISLNLGKQPLYKYKNENISFMMGSNDKIKSTLGYKNRIKLEEGLSTLLEE